MTTELTDLPSAPTTQRVILTWVVRSAIATALVWGWIAWQGGPSWLWAALPIYIVVSLVLSLIMNAVMRRKVAELNALIEQQDYHDDP